MGSLPGYAVATGLRLALDRTMQNRVIRYRLTMVSVNGRTVFAHLPVDRNNKPLPVDRANLMHAFGVRRGDCVRFGS
jgi:hypothetical protein